MTPAFNRQLLCAFPGVLFVTMRSSGSSASAAKQEAAAAPVKAAAAKCGPEDSDAAALLPDGHLQSHLPPTAAAAEAAQAGDSVAAVAVVQLCSDRSLSQKLDPSSGSPPAGQDLQGLSAAPEAAAAATEQLQQTARGTGLLAQLAASAAAALGGELCPAGSTAMGL